MSPQYCNIKDAVILFFKNYVNFSGRSTRSEYWWWTLASLIISGVFYGIATATDVAAISTLWSLAVLVPGIALAVRRLHDIGKSGLYYLLILIPLVGSIILIVWFCKPSDGSNEYGEPAGSDSYF